LGENRIDNWLAAAEIDRGKLFSRVNKVAGCALFDIALGEFSFL